MSYWTLIQVIFDLFVFAALVATWWRLRRPPQDDPRLSRGLQLLQTKITVLEDLSDRTDAQVKQLTTLIDQKTRALQNKVIEAEQQIVKIDHSVVQSTAAASAAITAQTPHENLPHHEIVERQRTVEYVKAAKMANAGSSIEEISAQVKLPREQIELIAKFNRDQLMFDESQLPDWAQKENGGFTMSDIDFVGNLDKPTPDFAQLNQIESNFKKAVDDAKRADAIATQSILETRVAESIKASMASGIATMQSGMNSGMETMQPAVMAMKATAQTLKEKLVSTAEDMLRHQQPASSAQHPTMSGTPHTITSQAAFTPQIPGVPNARPDAVFKTETPKVKKVIFPRIEKP